MGPTENSRALPGFIEITTGMAIHSYMLDSGEDHPSSIYSVHHVHQTKRIIIGIIEAM